MRDFWQFCRMFAYVFWLARGVLFALLVIVVVCAFVTFSFEEMGFWDAFYMSFITALTIGYGDLTPITTIGKIMSILTGFTGLVFVGLVVAIATVSMRHVMRTHRLHR